MPTLKCNTILGATPPEILCGRAGSQELVFGNLEFGLDAGRAGMGIRGAALGRLSGTLGAGGLEVH